MVTLLNRLRKDATEKGGKILTLSGSGEDILFGFLTHKRTHIN